MSRAQISDLTAGPLTDLLSLMPLFAAVDQLSEHWAQLSSFICFPGPVVFSGSRSETEAGKNMKCSVVVQVKKQHLKQKAAEDAFSSQTFRKFQGRPLPPFASCSDTHRLKVFKLALKKCKPLHLKVVRATGGILKLKPSFFFYR